MAYNVAKADQYMLFYHMILVINRRIHFNHKIIYLIKTFIIGIYKLSALLYNYVLSVYFCMNHEVSHKLEFYIIVSYQ